MSQRSPATVLQLHPTSPCPQNPPNFRTSGGKTLPLVNIPNRSASSVHCTEASLISPVWDRLCLVQTRTAHIFSTEAAPYSAIQLSEISQYCTHCCCILVQAATLGLSIIGNILEHVVITQVSNATPLLQSPGSATPTPHEYFRTKEEYACSLLSVAERVAFELALTRIDRLSQTKPLSWLPIGCCAANLALKSNCRRWLRSY